MDVVRGESETAAREAALARRYREESVRTRAAVCALRRAPHVFQSSRCAACSRPLELPSVHFLCQHSYHHHCFQSYSESEECPACAPQRRQPAPRSPDALHQRLRHDPDPYAVVAEYFGRGMFNKVKVVTEGSSSVISSDPAPAPAPAPTQNYGPGAEAKLRLQEGQSKQVFVPNSAKQTLPKGTTLVPVPEGRMRVLEQQNYPTLDPKSNTKSPYGSPKPASQAKPIILPMPKKKDQPRTMGGSPKISTAISNGTKSNPFEENYDDAKNPFAAEDAQDPTNPFADDYDTNLNPFS